MSNTEVTQAAPDGAVTEGAQSPVAAKEDVTATSEETPKPEKEGQEAKSERDKRLAALAYEAREAKRLAKAETEARETLERELQAMREGKGVAPKAEDFESYEAYLDARQEWLVDQKLKEREKQSVAREKEAKATEEKARKAARLESVMTDGAETYKDFHATLQALDEAVANPEEIRMALDAALESDRSRDLLYYLGKNPSVVASLGKMSPMNQAREIGRLEALFESKKLTAAPDPVKTLKGNGGRVTSDAPPSDPVEYRKWRAKQK